MQDILLQAGILVAVIALGYLLRRFGVFPKESFGIVSKLVLYITLPCVVIRNFAKTDMEPAYLIIIGIGFLCMAAYTLIGYLINRKKGVDAQIFDMLNFTGFNIGCFALPYISGLLGPAAVVSVCMFDAGSALGATGGVAAICRSMKDGDRFRIRPFLKRFAKAFLPLVYITMILLRFLSVPIPSPVIRFCDLCGGGNSFLAMLMIGLGISLNIPKAKLKWILKASSIRFGFAILLGTLLYFVLPFSMEVRLGIFLALLAPVSTLNPAFTREWGGDYELASSWNTVTILISLVLMTIVMLLAV